MTRWARIFAVVAVVAIACGAWQAQRASRFHDEKVQALAQAKAQRTADSLRVVEAERAAAASDSALRVADRHRDTPRPPKPLPPDTTPSDSVRYWRERTTVAEEDARLAHAEASALRVALDSQKVATARLRVAYEGEQARGDSLAAVLSRAPDPCPKVPLLGIPLPKFGPAGVLTRNGFDVGLAAVIPLGGC